MGRAARGKEAIISAIDSKVKVLLIPTNEELMIALETAALVGGKSRDAGAAVGRAAHHH